MTGHCLAFLCVCAFVEEVEDGVSVLECEAFARLPRWDSGIHGEDCQDGTEGGRAGYSPAVASVVASPTRRVASSMVRSVAAVYASSRVW